MSSPKPLSGMAAALRNRVAIAAVAAAATASAIELNLWPVATVETGPEITDVRALGPLLQVTAANDGHVFALRPLLIRRRRDDTGARSLDLAYPLVRFARNREGGRSRRIVPFFWGTRGTGEAWTAAVPILWKWWHQDRQAGASRGLVVPPFWITGRYGDSDDGAIGLAPLAWRWRDGSKQATWVLPIYRQMEGDEQVLLSVALMLWMGRGSLVLFPFYWSLQEGATHVVFPFYWSFGNGSTQVLFPFFGRSRSEDAGWLMLFWPGYVGRHRQDYREHTFAWPLLSWGTTTATGKRSRFRLWPLIGWSQRERHQDRLPQVAKGRWALWPLLWWGSQSGRRLHHSTPDDVPEDVVFRNTRFSLFPLFWQGRRQAWTDAEGPANPKMVEDDTHTWMLPVFTWNRSRSRAVLTVLWPLWRRVDGDEADQYSVLWRLADVRTYANGDHTINVLWRGYRDEKRGGKRKFDLFPFITYRRNGEGDRRLQFLSGLLEWGKSEGKGYFRCLYLPR